MPPPPLNIGSICCAGLEGFDPLNVTRTVSNEINPKGLLNKKARRIGQRETVTDKSPLKSSADFRGAGSEESDTCYFPVSTSKSSISIRWPWSAVTAVSNQLHKVIQSSPVEKASELLSVSPS